MIFIFEFFASKTFKRETRAKEAITLPMDTILANGVLEKIETDKIGTILQEYYILRDLLYLHEKVE